MHELGFQTPIEYPWRAPGKWKWNWTTLPYWHGSLLQLLLLTVTMPAFRMIILSFYMVCYRKPNFVWKQLVKIKDKPGVWFHCHSALADKTGSTFYLPRKWSPLRLPRPHWARPSDSLFSDRGGFSDTGYAPWSLDKVTSSSWLIFRCFLWHCSIIYIIIEKWKELKQPVILSSACAPTTPLMILKL